MVETQLLTQPDIEDQDDEDVDPGIEQDTPQDDNDATDDQGDDQDPDELDDQFDAPPDTQLPPDPDNPNPKTPENPKGLPYPGEIVPPNRTRVDTIRYGVCSASAYSVPDFGPLYLLDRGQEPSCSVYLYPAIYGLSRPLLPKLPPRPTPQPHTIPAPPPASPRPPIPGPPTLLDPSNTTPPDSLADREPASNGSTRRLLGRPLAPVPTPRSARDDSHVAIGVLAAAINFAAEEQLSTVTELQELPGVRTPRSAGSLPPDIGHWTHVQLQKVRHAGLGPAPRSPTMSRAREVGRNTRGAATFASPAARAALSRQPYGDCVAAVSQAPRSLTRDRPTQSDAAAAGGTLLARVHCMPPASCP